MNQINKQTEVGREMAAGAIGDARPVASPARRRLIKLGTAAVPVVATLTSRPAFAWHCQSPSAWGSEIINPNTSLKTNAGHRVYADETWTITNWTTNTPRIGSGLDDDGVTGKPWSELLTVSSSLYNDQTKTKNSKGRYYFDFQKVTVGHLVSFVSGFVNPGFSNDTLVRNVTSSDPKTYPLIAQLNYIVLKQVKFNNDIDMCIKDGQLADMASGTYRESGQGWSSQKVKEYLYNNYIVRP